MDDLFKFPLLPTALRVISRSVQHKLRDLERNTAEAHHIIQLDLHAAKRHVAHDQPEVIVDHVVRVLVLVSRLEQVIITLVVNYIYELLLVKHRCTLDSLFVFAVLRGRRELNIVRAVLGDDAAANQLDLAAFAARLHAVQRVAQVERVKDPVSFMKVEQSVALLFFPQPRLDHELHVNLTLRFVGLKMGHAVFLSFPQHVLNLLLTEAADFFRRLLLLVVRDISLLL